MSAGTVKTTPPAIDSPAEPIVCTMLFSRMVDPPRRFRTDIASTAIGMDALTVSPARSPRYTVEAPNNKPNSAPMTIAFSVNSAGAWVAATYGANTGTAGGGGRPGGEPGTGGGSGRAGTRIRNGGAMRRDISTAFCYNLALPCETTEQSRGPFPQV